MWSVGACVVALIIILLTKYIYRWRNPACNGVLPPGSLGIPLIGETLELIIPSYTVDIHPFLKKRLQRYGPLFRTNVAGRNVVVSADREFNHLLFKQEGKLVVRAYLDLFEAIFKQGENRPDGSTVHKFMRGLVLSHFGVDCIKKNLLPQFSDVAKKTLHSWSIQDSIELESASMTMFGEFGARQLYMTYDSERAKKFVDKFLDISKGAMSFPLKIPGTRYYKCLKDREEVLKYIRDIVNARLVASPQSTQDDLLGKMIQEMKRVNFLTPEFITQSLYTLTFATNQSIPSILVFVLKFVSENPAVLEELIAEHEEILRKRENSDSSISWEEYKSMTFTLQVVNETLRLANAGPPGFMRKAIKDIQVQGYTIPAGWTIMACHSVQHLDPDLYKDPLKFNPWRWKDIKPEFISKNLIPFGEGIKQCAGADFTRASLSIFLHFLVTKYRWTVIKGGNAVQDPTLHLKNGLHISISERQY